MVVVDSNSQDGNRDNHFFIKVNVKEVRRIERQRASSRARVGNSELRGQW